MEMQVKLKDVVKLLELSKRKAEIAFKLEISEEEEKASHKSQLESVLHQMDRLSQAIEKAGIVIAMPNECEIAHLNDALSKHSAHEILDAMKKREGETYKTLVARGKLIKQNFENRENIAKLALLTAKLKKEVRDAIVEVVRRGKIEISIPLLDTEPAPSNKIATVLGRLGIPASVEENALMASEKEKEIAVQLPNRKVWVSPEIHGKLDLNLAKIREISSKIQLKNAVRQIKQFSEDEEKEFAAMQDDYLKLLKEQDELLKEFFEEDKLALMF